VNLVTQAVPTVSPALLIHEQGVDSKPTRISCHFHPFQISDPSPAILVSIPHAKANVSFEAFGLACFLLPWLSDRE
jgi:hypothetical protein